MNTTLQRLRAAFAGTARNLFQKNCGVVVVLLSCCCHVVMSLWCRCIVGSWGGRLSLVGHRKNMITLRSDY